MGLNTDIGDSKIINEDSCQRISDNQVFTKDMRLGSYISSTKKIIDNYLIKYLSSATRQNNEIRDAATYTILNGGRRWRPILLLTVGRNYGVTDAELLPMACIVELVHTASLFLDDLPCMDDAQYRHGQPTCHLVFGEDLTILASHFLLATCFKLVAFNYKIPWYSAELSALITDMVSGQAADLRLNKKEMSRKELERIYIKKSGRLFGFSAKMGAALANAPPLEVKRLELFGQTLGLAYQILDDVYDIVGNPSDAGKDIGKDRDKLTFAKLFNPEVATDIAKRYKVKALSILGNISIDTDKIRQFCDYIFPSSKI